MRQIKLTKGKYAIVDDSDFDYLNQFKWYFDGRYAMRNGIQKNYKRKHIWMHRLINQTSKDKETDHINRNKLDNRRINLRTVTRNGNQWNRDKYRTNTSGYKGIMWHKATQKWLAQIKVNSKHIHLGIYDDIQKALLARRKGEELYHVW